MVVDTGNGLGRGPGYWKMNVSLMDLDGSEEFRALWSEHRKGKGTHVEGVDGWFAEGIEKARALFQGIGKRRARTRRAQERDMRDQLMVLDKLVTRHPENSTYPVALHRTKENLRKIDREKMKGAQIRCREKDEALNETCSAYFFRKEKTRGEAGTVTSLREFTLDAEGKVVYGLESASSPEELIQVALDFYSKLHRRRPVLASAQDELLREVREFPPGAADMANGELGPEETAVATLNSVKVICGQTFPESFDE